MGRMGKPKKPAKPPFDPTAQPGVIAPLGYFDPLGYSSVGMDKERFFRDRDLELKHGRIAMMASWGHRYLCGAHQLLHHRSRQCRRLYLSRDFLVPTEPGEGTWKLRRPLRHRHVRL